MKQDQDALEKLTAGLMEKHNFAAMNKFPDWAIVIRYALNAFAFSTNKNDPWGALVKHCEAAQRQLLQGTTPPNTEGMN